MIGGAGRLLLLAALVTELGPADEAITRADETVSASAVPVGEVPVLLEGSP